MNRKYPNIIAIQKQWKAGLTIGQIEALNPEATIEEVWAITMCSDGLNRKQIKERLPNLRIDMHHYEIKDTMQGTKQTEEQ